MHLVQCQLRHRSAPRWAAHRAVRGDKAHPTSHRCGEKGVASRPLPERSPSADHSASPARQRPHVRRNRSDTAISDRSWPCSAESVTRTAERPSSTTERRAGEPLAAVTGDGATAARSWITYSSNALAQEKTGEFWVDGQLFGRPRCHTTGDYEHAEVAVFVGKNPWQSHGFPRARTPAQGDCHGSHRGHRPSTQRDGRARRLPPAGAPRHGRLWPRERCFAVLVEEDLVDERGSRTPTGWTSSRPTWRADRRVVRGRRALGGRRAAGRLAEAFQRPSTKTSASTGAIQDAESSYLQKLVYLLTGTFSRKPVVMNIHSLVRQPRRWWQGWGRPSQSCGWASHHHRPGPSRRGRSPTRSSPIIRLVSGHAHRELEPGPLPARQCVLSRSTSR